MNEPSINNLSVPSNTKKKAAVVFIIFRRPETTKKVFQQIRQAKPEKLYVIADGPRVGNPLEQGLVDSTRRVVEDIDWPCQVIRIYASANMGLRERIFTGLDEVFAREESAIVLEDDCLPSRSFFEFCNELLVKYSSDAQIALVSGFNFAPSKKARHDYFFSHSTYIWGWATWASNWKAFRSSPQVESWSEEETNEIKTSFASGIQRREFLGMMAIANTLNTWDISLAVWMRQQKKLSIIPRLNLIENIGFGAQATHTKFEAFDVQTKRSDFIGPLSHPEVVICDTSIEKRMWISKSTRWLTFPARHPIQFINRFVQYFKIR